MYNLVPLQTPQNYHERSHARDETSSFTRFSSRFGGLKDAPPFFKFLVSILAKELDILYVKKTLKSQRTHRCMIFI
jgi:hypothetical protein